MKNPCIEPLEARIAPAVLTIVGPNPLDEGTAGQTTDMIFKVVLDTPSPIPLTVKVNTADGTATVADGDYIGLTNFTVSIPANTLEKTFTVQVKGDTKYEADETFSVSLSDPSVGNTIGAASTATGTIRNTDELPKLSIATKSELEGNTGTTDLKFRVSLSNLASEAITFDWNAHDLLTTAGLASGTTLATAGVDYTAATGTATIPAGSSFVDVTLSVTGDRDNTEKNEAFEVSLANAKLGAALTPLTFVTDKDKANMVITNDDAFAYLAVSSGSTANPLEGETTLNFDLKLTTAASENIKVFLTLGGGTATAGVPDDTTADLSDTLTAGADYLNAIFIGGVKKPFDIEIEKGSTSVTFSIKIKGDNVHEPDETFTLAIDHATVGTAGDPYDFQAPSTESAAVQATSVPITIRNDEAEPTITLRPSVTIEPNATVGSKTMPFLVELSGPASEDVTFKWSTTAESAEAGDFTSVTNQSVTIPAGQTTATLNVTVFNDADGDVDDFSVSLAEIKLGTKDLTATVGGNNVHGSIRENPLSVSVLAPVPATVTESAGVVRFTVSRAAGDSTTEALNVYVSTVDGSAKGGVDFTKLTLQKVTIPAGAQSNTVAVTILDDNGDELDESFSLNIDRVEFGNARLDAIGTASATATITDNDAVPALTVNAATVTEGNSGTKTLTFRVTAATTSSQDITFIWNTSDIASPGSNVEAALAGTDYEAKTGQTATIPAGQTFVDLTVTVNGDLISESNQVFQVQISNVVGGTVDTVNKKDIATLTIVDDEPNITVVAPAATVEGTVSLIPKDFTFAVNLSKAATQNIAVRVGTVPGTATVEIDFKATERWIIIPAGSTTGTVLVPVVQDDLNEISETFSLRILESKIGVDSTLTLGQPTGGVEYTASAAAPDATATITDDDTVGLSISDATILEGNSGTQQLVFTVTLPNASSRDIEFDFSTIGGTAAGGADFVAITGGHIVIPAGSKSAQVLIDVLGDTNSEADETFTVRLANGRFVDAPTVAVALTDFDGLGTITNDEQSVSIQATGTVVENVSGGFAEMLVTLSSVSEVDVTVNISLTNGTALKGTDFLDPTPLSVTIPHGQTTATVFVPIVNDAVFEVAETFDVYITSATNALLGVTTRGTVTITPDADIAPKLSIANVSVTEGTATSVAGTEFTNMEFTVNLDRAVAEAVTFDWQTLTTGTAESTDFTAVGLTTVTIPANETSVKFVVKVVNDNIYEPDDIVNVLISNLVGAVLSAPDVVGGGEKTVPGTIKDNEAEATIGFTQDVYKVFEGDSGTTQITFTVTLSTATEQDVTFEWRTVLGDTNAATSGVDYVSGASTDRVRFHAGETQKQITVVVNGDTDVEADETFILRLNDPEFVDGALVDLDPNAAGTNMNGGTLTALGVIRNDDITATIVPTYSVTETEALVDVEIPVTISAPAPTGKTVRIGFEFVTGTTASDARAGIDFTVPTDLFVEFTGAETTKNIKFQVKPDDVHELLENFSIKLKDATTVNAKVGTQDTTLISITDSATDVAPVITIGNVGGNESAGSMVFTVALDRESSTEVTVDVSTLDGTAISTGALLDYVGAPLTVKIPAGSKTASYTVSVIPDNDAEGIETFTVRLANPVGATLSGAGATLDAVGTIADADYSAIQIASAQVTEGTAATPGKLTFVVSRAAGSSTTHAVSGTFTISLDGTATAADIALPLPETLTGLLKGTFTIPAGQSSANVEVTLTGDATPEGDETFSISLSAITDGFLKVATDGKAKGTILEDDVKVGFVAGPDTQKPLEIPVSEADGSVSFKLDIPRASTEKMIVTFLVTPGTAVLGGDYTITKDSLSNLDILTLTIPAGTTEATPGNKYEFVVPLTNDTAAEPNENFTIEIKKVETEIGGKTEDVTSRYLDSTNSTRTAVITDDDAVLAIVNKPKLIEGNSGTSNMVFTVRLSNAGTFVAGTQYTVDFATSNETAIAGEDYTATTGTLTFTATSGNELTVSVPVSGDTASEDDETLKLTLSNAKKNGQAISAILTDSSQGTIQDDESTVTVSTASVSEGDSGSQQMIFVVSLIQATNHPVVLTFSTEDVNATAALPSATDLVGKDYRGIVNGTVTIPAGQRTVQIPVTTFGDRVYEPNESFNLKITDISGAKLAGSDPQKLTVQGTITENGDPVPRIKISDAVVIEGDSGATTMKFRVALVDANSETEVAANADVTFDWATAFGTATADDLDALSGQHGTVPEGKTFVEIEVPITSDTLVEGNENFTVNISNAVLPNTTSGQPDNTLVALKSSAVGTISDDDGTIQASDSTVTFDEGAGKAKVLLNVPSLTVNAGRTTGEFTVTYTLGDPTGTGDVKATGRDATATTATADYVRPTTFTKTFAAGTLETDLYLEVDLVNDSVDEWDEKFVVTITGATGAKLSTVADSLKSVVTITDDDAAPTLQISNISVAESVGNAQFQVRLVGNVTERNISFTWDTIEDSFASPALAGSDFTAPVDTGKTATITAGARASTLSVAIIDDTDDEADEQFKVAILTANFVNGTTTGDVVDFVKVSGVDQRNSVATILKNDLRVATVSGGTVVEGATGNTKFLEFTIKLDAKPKNFPVTVDFATLTTGTATSSAVSTEIAKVDFTAKTGSVTFGVGQFGVDQNPEIKVQVAITSDDVAETDETVKLKISKPADSPMLLLGAVGTDEATGTILADESTFKLVWTTLTGTVITTGDPTAAEGESVYFRIQRTGPTGFASFPASVSYSTLEDASAGAFKATIGTDFDALVRSIQFASNQTLSPVIEVKTVQDTLAEPEEKFLIKLTSATNGVISAATVEVNAETHETKLVDAEKSIKISDDEVYAEPKVLIEAASVLEGGNLEFTVKLVNGTGDSIAAPYPMTVSYQTLVDIVVGAGKADASDFPTGFSNATKTLTFAVGESSKKITATTKADTDAEPAETMTVKLTKVEKTLGTTVDVPTPFYGAGEAIGTILNDDTIITVASVTQAEGDSASSMVFKATIPTAVSFDVKFFWNTKNGTATETDFTAVGTAVEVTIPAGQTEMPFSVTITGDTVRENDESFTVQLSAPTNAVLAGVSATTGIATTTGTITNDDVGPQLVIANAEAVEGGNLVFTVSLIGTITAPVTVDFATSDVTATSTGVLQDYIAQHGTLTFAVGDTSKTITIVTKADSWKEGNDTFNLALSNANSEATILTGSASGTILDDGDTTVGVSLGNATVVEGGQATFTLTLTTAISGGFSVHAKTRTGSADLNDFNARDETVSFADSTNTSYTFTVATRADNTFEATENFFVDLTNASAGVQFVPGGTSAQAVIYNDDERIISAQEFEFIDEDGDLVNVKVSKGALFSRNALGILTDRGIVTRAAAGTVGGKSISAINILGTGREFEGANISVTRKPQIGFEQATDGQVNVGELIAASIATASLQQGVNLGSVKIDGDLGRIVAGSTLLPLSIAKLDVRSLGVETTTSQATSQSILFGKAGSIHIRGDLGGALFALGSTVNFSTGVATGLGSISSITVDGKLVGGDADQTGMIQSNSKIGKITVGGIEGGDGEESGRIQAATSIGSFTALGDVVGGSGLYSGQVLATTIGKVQFGKAGKRGVAPIIANLIGGEKGADTSLDSNQILAQVGSGSIISFAGIKSIQMTGSIQGGDGDFSGMILSKSNVSKASISEIVGGAGENSGRLRISGAVSSLSVGTIQGNAGDNSGSVEVDGKISQVKLGSILGPESASATITGAGSLLAGDLGKVVVSGDIKRGGTAGGVAYNGSGSLISKGSIASLTVLGSIEGVSVEHSAVVSAAKNIGNVKVGTLKFAEILAGYSSAIAAGDERGSVSFGDAQIGSVTANTLASSSIVAGVSAGADSLFGTANDSSVGTTSLISRIASLTVRQSLDPAVSGESAAGIVAQSIGRVKVAGVVVPFDADTQLEIPTNSKVFINVV